MLHAIGRRERARDLSGMLLDCHGRIRAFSGLAIAIGQRLDTPEEEVVDVCTRVERYFTQALPLHVQDEEESVLPRLRGRSPEIDAALERMQSEHDLHLAPLEQMLARSAAVRAAPGDASARASLYRAAQALQTAFEPHLSLEEQVLFPALRDLVPRDEQEAMVRELRGRRAMG